MADLMTLQKFEALSPFEIKDELIKLAKATSQDDAIRIPQCRPRQSELDRHHAARRLLPARPVRHHREQAGDGASRRDRRNAAGQRHCRPARRLARASTRTCPAPRFLSAMVQFAVKKFGFDPDAFVHELVDSIIGDNYPVPDRMLVHNERIVHEYLMWAMCGEPRPAGKFDLYAVEGGTAAMCYIFKSLKANRLLHPGDTIALGTPIFTPYLEMTHLEDYDLKVVHIKAPQENRFQFTDEEIKKLEDPKIKAFFIVNPGNPTGMAMSKETIAKIAKLVKTKRPDLMLLTDDVYGTFVDDFRSLLGELPQNTIGVYSYSKYFGCTGWRLGVIAIHEDNIFDKMIAKLPDADVKALDKRYGPLTLEPRKIKFIDRIVADSRDVGAQPHRRAVAAAAGDDEPVLALRDDGRRRRHTRRPAWRSCNRRVQGHDRRPGPRASRRTRTTTPITA